ncbi:hypothetical protein [Pseudoalteromonas denitrificans]|uniref:Extracellular solute-binding protein, family 3 n=1 Tax=Pseudoalteromonas denitrificans DSM 6059 TaxID=1123010 RepID=A0A1I1E6R3_9GAMM|nr:hypothetical protein [Pseudoalteromonas denitrificans]SFB82342.1 hypothetical protein SAMN02745724_00227 [Pseudoalteromonas denitrificans DSM 6059]
MSILKSFNFKVLLLLCILNSSTSFGAEDDLKTVNIPITSDLDILSIYKAIILEAYNRLDYRVIFHQMAPGRALLEIEAGHVDALLVKVANKKDEKNKSIIKVPILLAQGYLMLYCQKELLCNQSVFDNKKNVIGTVSGVTFSSHLLKNKRASRYQVKNGFKLAKMFEKGRLNYIISLDEAEFGNYVFIDKSKYLSVQLNEIKVYHYVHEKLAFLVPKLTVELRRIMLKRKASK